MEVRLPMYKRNPSWVVMNYPDLTSGLVNSMGETGMLIQAKVEA
jgi:hypothetical protein